MTVDVGGFFESLINWLRGNVSWFFDGISWLLGQIVGTAQYVLIALHPVVIIGVLVLLAAAVTRRPGLPVFTAAGFGLIAYMGLWIQTMQTVAMVVVAVLLALVVGIPLGIWAALDGRISALIRPVLDLMQSMPVFVYLIPAVFFFGVGTIPGIAATIIFSVAPAVRLTELGIRQLDAELLEAARAFGAKPGLILRDVQLPLALKSIMAGINQVIMLALSMVVVAGLVGAGGLGGVVVEGVARLDTARGFEGGIAVVIVAVFLDRLTGGAQSLVGFLRERRAQRSASRQHQTSQSPAEQVRTA